MSKKPVKPPTKRELTAARKLIASSPSVLAQVVFILEAACPGYLVAALTPKGNGFTCALKTNRLLRGMIRKALREETQR